MRLFSQNANLPNVHAVDERVNGVEVGAVDELLNIPHQLVHDLGKLDGESRWASTTTSSTVAGVSDVALVVGAVKVLSVPAAAKRVSLNLGLSEEEDDLTQGR